MSMPIPTPMPMPVHVYAFPSATTKDQRQCSGLQCAPSSMLSGLFKSDKGCASGREGSESPVLINKSTDPHYREKAGNG